jgi:hypothetical protein
MAVSAVKSSLLDSPMWFTLKAPRDPETADVNSFATCWKSSRSADFVEEYVKCSRKAVRHGLRQAPLGAVDGAHPLRETPLYDDPQQMQMAQMQGMPTTQPSITSEPRPRSGLKCYHVPVWNIYPDPAHQNYRLGRYIVEEVMVDQEEIEDGIRLGTYNCLDDIKDIGSPFGLTYEFERRQREAMQTTIGRRGRASNTCCSRSGTATSTTTTGRCWSRTGCRSSRTRRRSSR